MTGAWLKLEMLRFLTPTAARSTYVGGGLSWSTANLDSQSKSWSGDGLQGELTAGYELQRASTVRVFFQADLGLPFYRLRADTYVFQLGQPYPYSTGSERRYCPSLSLSMGLGWQRGAGR